VAYGAILLASSVSSQLVTPDLGILNTVTSGVQNTLSCILSGSTWTDPYLGKVDLDAANWCNSECWRHVPKATCCMPMSPAELKAEFHIYTPSQPEKRTLTWEQINAEPAPSSDKIVIAAHGFLENSVNSVWMPRMKDAYVAQGYTVILVDWRRGNQLNYFQAFSNVRTVGMMVAKVVLNWKISDRLLLVGFSLGGQIIGQAARMVKRNGGLVKRCHALDPAGPFFTGCPQYAIQKDDCEVVEAIHSSAEIVQNAGVASMNFGTRTKSGHCDYWVNCGFSQGLACTNLQLSELLTSAGTLARLNDAEFTAWASMKICAHMRGAMVYVAQLERKCDFHVRECPDCGQGYKCTPGNITVDARLAPFGSCNKNQNVNYFVRSGDVNPYCEDDKDFKLLWN